MVCLFKFVTINIRSFNKFSKTLSPHHLSRALPLKKLFKRSTKIDFAENQLSPSLISLSLLITNHPNIFPHIRVRSSEKRFRFNINQFMISSLGFGSYFNDYRFLKLNFFTPTYKTILSSPSK